MATNELREYTESLYYDQLRAWLEANGFCVHPDDDTQALVEQILVLVDEGSLPDISNR